MSTPSNAVHSTMPALSPTERMKLNATMLEGIIEQGNTYALDDALRGGADPNAIGVIRQGEEEPSKNPPLIEAVGLNNDYAVQALLNAKANPYAVNYDGKVPAIFIAVANGNQNIVSALLAKEPNLINTIYDGWTLLHMSVLVLTPHSLSYDGECEPNGEYTSAVLHDMLINRYKAKYGAPTPPDNLIIRYKGHQEIVQMLLSKAPGMINALGKKGVTPLEIIMNPIKFKHLFYDCNALTTIQCLTTTTENVSVLTFSATNCNLKGWKRYPVTVHFDFTELQLLFEKAKSLHPDNEHLGSQLSHVQTQLTAAQQKLTEVHAQTALLALPKVQRAEWDAWINAAGHENLATFYHFLVTKFENIIMSFKAVDGGQISPKEGKVAAIGSVLGNVAGVVSIVPLVGDAVEKILQCMEAVLKKIDESRELNTAKQVGKINWTDVVKEGPILARMLTAAFAQQLLELPTPKEAQEAVQCSTVKKGIHQLNALVLKGQFIPPAEVEAMVAMTWVVEFLYETPNIAEQIRAKGLATVFFTAIIGQNPPDRVNAFWSAFSKKMGGVSTKSGDTWNSEDMYVYTGIRTQEGNFCVHTKSKPETYGWRLVTLPVLTELTKQFTLTPVPTPNKLPPAYLRELKIPQSPYAKKLASDSTPSNDTSTDNSLHLPMPPVSTAQPAPLTFRKTDSTEMKEAADALSVPQLQQPSAASRAASPVAARSLSPSPGPVASRLRFTPKNLLGKLVSATT